MTPFVPVTVSLRVATSLSPGRFVFEQTLDPLVKPKFTPELISEGAAAGAERGTRQHGDGRQGSHAQQQFAPERRLQALFGFV